MTVLAKICGLRTAETIAAAVAGRARYVGFVAYPPSPRHLAFHEAEALAAEVPAHLLRVGLFVDPDDRLLGEWTEGGALDMLQLHGIETAARVREIRESFELPVMKAVRVATRDDVRHAIDVYAPVADRLLFDAAPPSGDSSALPGGNGLPFDWRLLDGVEVPVPWMLSGGLTADNVAAAVRATGAKVVDVSSGVESSRGVKSPELIRRFLAAVAAL
ncbi:MAG: phosphoribosylanthranilate isomerase [Rhodospirillales bacterium]|nr:MAG: phosphoribosylanthranilate isomerase [Rhodospirillales bacterium]